MTGFPAQVADLITVLETERRVILEGRLMELEPLQVEKERLVAGVCPGSVSAASVGRLRSLAEANIALLAAAREGLAAARMRLRELERLGQGGASYDHRGARVTGPSEPSRPCTMRRV